MAVLAAATGGTAMIATAQAQQPQQAQQPPSTPARVFFSGHSLMDQPMPDFVAAIARGEGRELAWERQHLFGSLLRQRTVGDDPTASTWTGWSKGENRQGQGLDTAAALSGRIAGLAPFDTLVVTERHDILWAMQNESSARHLRRMHDERVRGQPRGRTWLYESWQSMSPDRIGAWVEYENMAAGAWQCLASEVNRSLAGVGRADRVHSLPVARALAMTVARATISPGIPGLSATTPQATVERLFSDAVHLTEAGRYFAALTTWAFISGQPARVQGGWAPPQLDPALASALRQAAADAHARLADQTLHERPAEACNQQLAQMCPAVWRYMGERWQAEGQSWPQARWKRFQLQRQCEAGVRDGRHRLVAEG